eukprot:TRINITY_DN9626_c0_g1_i3.p3 TRINITY_DN9626_c0_g1~~TRINITY_DN9626_c0_g1_i3.p3  ORF type:complete len:137 (-),score=19.41 TRINITY_DN9626_c0_g1_i3:170-580(-)
MGLPAGSPNAARVREMNRKKSPRESFLSSDVVRSFKAEGKTIPASKWEARWKARGWVDGSTQKAGDMPLVREMPPKLVSCGAHQRFKMAERKLKVMNCLWTIVENCGERDQPTKLFCEQKQKGHRARPPTPLRRFK